MPLRRGVPAPPRSDPPRFSIPASPRLLEWELRIAAALEPLEGRPPTEVPDSTLWRTCDGFAAGLPRSGANRPRRAPDSGPDHRGAGDPDAFPARPDMGDDDRRRDLAAAVAAAARARRPAQPGRARDDRTVVRERHRAARRCDIDGCATGRTAVGHQGLRDPHSDASG